MEDSENSATPFRTSTFNIDYRILFPSFGGTADHKWCELLSESLAQEIEEKG
jgi:hypothetical protein